MKFHRSKFLTFKAIFCTLSVSVTLQAESGLPNPQLIRHQSDAYRAYTQTNPFEQAENPLISKLVDFAKAQLGAPYILTGISPNGFDCSGFTHFVYNHVKVTMPHGSISQALLGSSVALAEARKGDLLIFTGTNPRIRKPGHVGIVLTGLNDKVKFIHSSSVGGVKISEVSGTRYSERLLDVRRVM